jgi:hypothetical protein
MMSITPQRDKWKGTMTDRERFNRQIRGKSVDRCFNMEFGYWKENYEQWSGFLENGIETEAQSNVFFNFDRISGAGGVTWIHPEFPEEVVEETEDKIVIRNGNGLLAEMPKDGHSTIPHFTKSSIESPADWDRVKKERFDVQHPDRILDIEKIKARHAPDRTYPLGVNCGSMIGRIRDMLSFEGLAYALYDYPEMVEDMVETACVLVEHSLDQILPHFDFDYASGWEDICFKNGPIVSVGFFNSVVVPRYKRIREKLDAHGVDIWYTDCDGDIRQIVPGFLEGGINVMFPFEVNGSGHPGELLDEYEGRLGILGGVDKTRLIAGPDETKRYLESLIPFVERGRFIPFCDHRCPPDVTYENYLKYLDMKEATFGL